MPQWENCRHQGGIRDARGCTVDGLWVLHGCPLFLELASGTEQMSPACHLLKARPSGQALTQG